MSEYTGLHVSVVQYDSSNYERDIVIRLDDHTMATAYPKASELPPEARAALLAWLGVES